MAFDDPRDVVIRPEFLDGQSRKSRVWDVTPPSRKTKSLISHGEAVGPPPSSAWRSSASRAAKAYGATFRLELLSALCPLPPVFVGHL